ncbi:MAG: hypothetical protein ACYC0V_21600 [Armatimonadota bacterium]
MLAKTVDALGPSPEKSEKNRPNRESRGAKSGGLQKVRPKVRKASISLLSPYFERKTPKTPAITSLAFSAERNLVFSCLVEEACPPQKSTVLFSSPKD